MRIAAIVSAALALMTTGGAAERSVSVCIDLGVGLPDLQLARMLASKIFAKAGTGIQWRCSGGPEQPIAIAMSTNTPDEDYPGALAYAQPFGGGIRVFYNRFHNYAPEMRAHLLAYVLVHEITHVLQGITRHSESGVMKAHWDDRDFRKISSMGMALTPLDVLLIHHGMAARSLAGSVLAHVH